MTLARDAAEEQALAHFDRVLGGRGPMAVIEEVGPVSLLQYVDAELGASHFVTLGYGRTGAEVVNPSELVITVRPKQEDDGLTLLRYAVQIAPQMSEITFGSSLVSEHRLVPELGVHGLMFDASPWTDQLDLVLSEDETAIELAVLTLLPMTEADVEFLRERGIEEFDHAVEQTAADVFDLHRTGSL
ncbi:suppressor of fused domain protein [Nakamurella lactea]|uniref:suppressor of fused domain protein n=1 Tax=Nakamurella lactea TaxID=459515 RepID=UPI0012B5B0FB|nr:suppressor of fused domain protein [Nakamurella lactea]